MYELTALGSDSFTLMGSDSIALLMKAIIHRIAPVFWRGASRDGFETLPLNVVQYRCTSEV